MRIFHISFSQFVSISTLKKKGGARTKSLKKENENIFSTEKKGGSMRRNRVDHFNKAMIIYSILI